MSGIERDAIRQQKSHDVARIAIGRSDGTSMAFQHDFGRVTSESWSRIISEFRDRSIYQTYAYAMARWPLKQIEHFRPLEDSRVVAAAQVRVVEIPVVGWGLAYVAWGPLWRPLDVPPDPDVWDRAIQALRDEYGRRRRLLLRIIPAEMACESERLLAGLRRYGFSRRKDEYRTLVVDLRSDPGATRRALGRAWRRNLAKAERANLRVEMGANADLVREVVQLHELTAKRKSFRARVPASDFLRMNEIASGGERLQSAVVYEGNQAIAGITGSALGRIGFELIKGSSTRGLETRASYLANWRFLEWLWSSGCSFYDLNGIDPQANPGTYQFKAGLAGRVLDQTPFIGTFELCDDVGSRVATRLGEGIRRSLRSL